MNIHEVSVFLSVCLSVGRYQVLYMVQCKQIIIESQLLGISYLMSHILLLRIKIPFTYMNMCVCVYNVILWPTGITIACNQHVHASVLMRVYIKYIAAAFY